MKDWITFELEFGMFRMRVDDFVRAVDIGDPGRCVVVYRAGSGEGSVIVLKGYEAVLAAIGRAVKPATAGPTPAARGRFVDLGDECFVRADSVGVVRESGKTSCNVDVAGINVRYVVRRPAADVVAELEAALARVD